jgi:hypothetical protein
MNDDAYERAIAILEQTRDPRPMADLMRHGQEMPPNVMARLADMIDPPSQRALVEEIRAEKHSRLRQMIAAYVAEGVGVEAAIMLVAEKTGRARSTLYKIWRK